MCRQVLVRYRFADGGSARKGDRIECAQPDAHHQGGMFFADPLNDRNEQSRAARKISSEGAGSGMGAEEFVKHVAMARLHIDKTKSGLFCHPCSGHECFDHRFQLGIFPEYRIVVARDGEPLIEQGVVVGDFWLELLCVRAAETTRVGQLQPHEQIVAVAKFFAMCGL